MTYDEFQMTNEIRNPNSEKRTKSRIRNPKSESNEGQALGSDFGLRTSFGFGHSDLVIVQYLTSTLRSSATEDGAAATSLTGRWWRRTNSPGKQTRHTRLWVETKKPRQ